MVTRNPFLAEGMGPPRREGVKDRPSASHRRSKKQESELAKSLKAALVPRSGAGDVKGDVRLRKVARIECKTTKNQSFPVTLELVRKLEDNVTDGEAPVLVVEFNEGGKKRGALAVIPLYLLEEFVQRSRSS